LSRRKEESFERKKMVSDSQVMDGKTGQVQPGTAWTAGVLGWFIPGAGHIMLGRWIRGLIILATVLAMFVLGLVFGGHLYSLSNADPQATSPLLRFPPVIANLGMGGIYLICWMLGLGFESRASMPTSEYGNTFLWVAGLLNYLAALDAFDIGIGRKQ
jgi:hypothetical protein